jgi:hypothetical protein
MAQHFTSREAKWSDELTNANPIERAGFLVQRINFVGGVNRIMALRWYNQRPGFGERRPFKRPIKELFSKSVMSKI